MRCYSELILLPTFEERYEYLRLKGSVGRETFGWDRYLNQALYRSTEWKRLRSRVVIRDGGNDLALDGYPVLARGQIHHINPLTPEQILDRDPAVFDPENLVLVSIATHNAIHYGVGRLSPKTPIERSPNDQCPWLIQPLDDAIDSV